MKSSYRYISRKYPYAGRIMRKIDINSSRNLLLDLRYHFGSEIFSVSNVVDNVRITREKAVSLLNRLTKNSYLKKIRPKIGSNKKRIDCCKYQISKKGMRKLPRKKGVKK